MNLLLEQYDSELFQWIVASPHIPNMKASQTMSEDRGGGTFYLSGRGKGVDLGGIDRNRGRKQAQ